MPKKANPQRNGVQAASSRTRRAAQGTTPRQAAGAPRSRPAHHPSNATDIDHHAKPDRPATAADAPPAPKPALIVPGTSSHGECRIFVGDCREVLSSLPECRRGAIDLIYADPPFNWARDYDRHDRAPRDNKVWDDAIDDDEYLRFTYEWLDLCVDALSPRGSIFVNIPDDWAAEIVVHLKRRRLTMINWCIWHYRFGQNTSNRFINSKVHVLYFARDRAERTWNEEPILEPSDRATTYADARTFTKKEGKHGHRVPLDVWYGRYWGRIQGNNAERRRRHDNQIPEVYMERVIRATSNEGDLVLDPFLGSGTTGLIARELRRRSIGIEYSKANALSAKERIEAGPHRVRYATPTVHVNPLFAARGSRAALAASPAAEPDDPTEE